MSGDPGKSQLLPETEYLLERDRAAYGTALTAYNGGDPLTDPPAFGYPNNMQVEIERRLILEADRTQKMNEVFSSPDSGWGTVQKFMDGVFDQYKTQNEAQLIKVPKDEKEAITQMQQLQPVKVDPNEVANIRQLVVSKLIPALKAVDPRFDFWTDPRTSNYAQWLNREAGPRTAGFMASGDQPVELGAVGRTAVAAWQGIEGAASVPINMTHGLWDIGRRSIQAMGGPDIGSSYPTNFIEKDGETVDNGGKVPSLMDGIGMSWDYALNNNIMQGAAQSGRAQEWEQANRAGLGGLITSVSRMGGELIGMQLPFGVAGQVGQKLGPLTVKGLQALGALRLARPLTQSTDRALKIIHTMWHGHPKWTMNQGLGTAAGWATYEMVNRGRVEGYGAAYLHGLIMSPVLIALGTLGKKTEWFARHRAQMPAVASRAISGALEGAGFGGVETIMPDVLPSSWGFIKDPNETTWERFARNMLAFTLVKVGTGRSFEAPPEVAAYNRGVARAQFAEEVAGGRVSPETLASAPIKDEAKLRRLGELSQRAKAGDQDALAQQRRLEAELDVEEFGKGPAANEEAQVDELLARARGDEPPEGPQQVPGKEPRPMRPVEDKPSPAEQMAQEGGREGLEPERFQDQGPLAERRAKEAAERRVRTSVDPLEDPRFRELPEPLQKELLAAKDAQARKELFAKHVGERRSGDERRVPRETPSDLEVRQGDQRTLSGSRAGPQSFQQPPTRNTEPTPGVPEVPARDIFAAYEGRPARGGVRIPLTGRRVGGDPGDPVKTTHRGGKISGRGVEGLYRMFENVFRTREGRDIVVGAHEWAHAMHRHMTSERGGRDFNQAARRQIQEIIRSPDGPAIFYEMGEVLRDYPGSARLPLAVRWMETWAEWHARNLLGEVGLDRALPAVSRYMRTWLAHPAQARLRDQYQRIQDLIFRYNAQGSEARLGQSIVSGAAPLTDVQRGQKPGPVRRFFTQVNKALFDDMAELKLSQDKWLQAVGRRPEDVSILDDPARLFDTLRMTADKVVDHFVNRGVRLPNGNFVPGLRSVMDAVRGREQDFQKFVVAIRSLDLYRTGKEVQLPIQDYTVSINRILTRNPDFNERLQELKRWTDALVDWVQGAGSISAEDAKKIKEKYVVYVPFFRAIEGPAQHGQGRGIAERGSGIGHIEGSTYEVLDPFVKLQEVARSMVAKAHQNQVMESLYKMAASQEAGPLATVVKRTTVPTEHPLSRIIEAMEQQIALPADLIGPAGEFYEALRQADALNPQTLTTFMQKVIPTGERSVIAFTPRLTEENIERLGQLGANARQLRDENNKLQWLEVDKNVYEALMGIDKMPQLPASLQPVMNWLQAPRDVVRFFATGISPGFVAANLIRDALSAPLFDRNGDFRPFGGFISLVRGAIEYHRNGEMRELYEELGVKSSSFWTEGRQRSLIGEQMTLWQRAKAMADTVQNWFSHPENYIRMDRFQDAYRTALREGRSEQEARMEALETGREATVNFARAGIWARAVNQLIPYFNAGLQGQRKLWGQLAAGGADTKGDQNKARVQRGAILNGLANITVPATLLWLLNKDEDWYQDLPEWRKVGYFNMKFGNEIISVPKPFEAGVVFGALPEIMLDHTFGQNPASMKAAMKGIAGPYLEVGTLIPAFIKPIVEVVFNKNTFTGRELTPEWISRSSPPQEQATFYTTETAKIMSRAIGGILTPIEIEQLTGGYSAGAATTALRVLDEISGLKDHPGLQANPLLRFSKQEPHGQSDFVDKLYQLGTRLEQNEDSLTGHEKSLKRRVDNAKKKISDLRKQYRAGTISRQDAERRSYELARPLVEDQNK